MKKISLKKLEFKRALLVILIVVLVVPASLWSWNRYMKKTSAAISWTASGLSIDQDDFLYIGKSGLQTARVWNETMPGKDPASSRLDWETSHNRIMLPPSPPYPATPANKVYDSSYLRQVNYTGGKTCPTYDSKNFNNCRAIFTDGTGAIIDVGQGDITINGYLFLGDRVVLKAKNIHLGPNAHIIGSGQGGGSAYSDNDHSEFGGLGAFNGGQTWKAIPGRPIYTPTPSYDPNDLINNVVTANAGERYYFPLTLSDALASYFTDSSDSPLYGGEGTDGSHAVSRVGQGSKTPPDETVAVPNIMAAQRSRLGVGGSGGSGGANGATYRTGNGAGGGGGGGYGIALYASATLQTDAGSVITVAGGRGGSGNTGGCGGAGGGGVVVFSAPLDGYKIYSSAANINVSGGMSRTQSGGRVCNAGVKGRFEMKLAATSTVDKKVTPINRDSLSDLKYQFDPYVLTDGDIVLVELNVTGLWQGRQSQVIDNLMKDNLNLSSATKICRPITDNTYPSPSPTGYTVDSDKITWNFTPPDSRNEWSFSYYCKVQSL